MRSCCLFYGLRRRCLYIFIVAIVMIFCHIKRHFDIVAMTATSEAIARVYTDYAAVKSSLDEQLLSTTTSQTLWKQGQNARTHLPLCILLQFVNADKIDGMQFKLKRLLISIFSNTNASLTFILIADYTSQLIANEVFKTTKVMHRLHKDTTVSYHNVYNFSEKVKGKLAPLVKQFSSGHAGDYYNHILFVLPAALHIVLPRTISQVIMLDTDLYFRSDIKDLHALFQHMTPGQILGLAREQQPTYRHAVYNYREAHPETKVGEPPPNGLTGFNSGVKLMKLTAMRESSLYNRLMEANTLRELVEKYGFQGHLGDQDFFTLISFQYPELFYFLPCQWNRQLCTWWRDNGYKDVFSQYFDCKPPIFVYHGNCNSVIPT